MYLRQNIISSIATALRHIVPELSTFSGKINKIFNYFSSRYKNVMNWNNNFQYVQKEHGAL
jgi:hypothetical protein